MTWKIRAIIAAILILSGFIAFQVFRISREVYYQRYWKQDVRDDTSKESLWDLAEQGDALGILNSLNSADSVTSPAEIVRLAKWALLKGNNLTALTIISATKNENRNWLNSVYQRRSSVCDNLLEQISQGENVRMEDVLIIHQWLTTDDCASRTKSAEDVRSTFGRRSETRQDKPGVLETEYSLAEHTRGGGGSGVAANYTKKYILVFTIDKHTGRVTNRQIKTRRIVETEYGIN